MTGKSQHDIESSLVMQTMAMTLKTGEALMYLEQHGAKMSDETYRRRKKKLLSAKNVNTWLNEHTQEKFASNHRQLLAKLEYQIDTLNRLFTIEAQKPDFVPHKKGLKNKDGSPVMVDNPAKKKYLLITLSKRLQEIMDFYAKMNLGTPVIANVMKKLNPNLVREMTDEDLAKGYITI